MIRPTDDPLLHFFKARFRPAGEAYRTNPRHSASARARLSWTAGIIPRAASARLLDISRGGAALLVAGQTPPVAGSVLVRLVSPAPTGWLEAVVLSVDPAERGRHRVRLQFREPCPDAILAAAVLGQSDPQADPTAPEAPA